MGIYSQKAIVFNIHFLISVELKSGYSLICARLIYKFEIYITCI